MQIGKLGIREVCGRITKVTGVVRPNLAPELQMEGEALGHALLEIEATSKGPLAQPEGSGSLVATYSCNMLATAPMAHDSCPYFRFTGTKGELVVFGNAPHIKECAGGGETNQTIEKLRASEQ